MNKKLSVGALASTSILVATIASAHVSVNQGGLSPADGSQEVILQIGHGCEDAGGKTTDTLSLKVDIPAGVTSVRGVSSADFPDLKIDSTAGVVTALTWSKTAGFPEDSHFYKLAFRAKMPKAPFTKIYFKAHQGCVGGTTAEWVAVPGDNSGKEPAAEVLINAPHTSGWNKITVPVAVAAADLPLFFKDAQIVWKGTSAFSPNAVTAEQIGKEAGVTPLTALAANDEILVKY